ncbi:MAG: LEPR-XLL domain-containing protein, partial [Chthoniobacteraceae bacterium]
MSGNLQNYELEPLEPRVMLSAGGAVVASAVVGAVAAPNSAIEVNVLQPTATSPSAGTLFAGMSLVATTPAEQTATQTPGPDQPVTASSTPAADPTAVQNANPIIVSDPAIQAVSAQPLSANLLQPAPPATGTSAPATNAASLAVETLTAANAPPGEDPTSLLSFSSQTQFASALAPAGSSIMQVPGGSISSNTTWSGTVQVNGDVTVATGVTLSLDPGTVVKFGPGRLLRSFGTLLAQSAAGNPIIFTSVNDNSVGEIIPGSSGTPSSGDWQSVLFESGSDASRLANVEIRYVGNAYNTGSGSGFRYSLWTRGSAAPQFSDVLVRDADASAIGIEETSAPTLTRVSVNRVARGEAFYVQTNALPVLNQLSVTGGAPARVLRQGGALPSQTLMSGGLVIEFDSSVVVNAGTTLTVPAGMVVKFRNGGLLQVFGNLQALGTAGNKIIFTST